jgi:RHS repeat-associated protein
MHQWNANTYAFTSPYRFNSKELDPETGLAYYGARYYQNKIGVWLSVDRYASKYPTLTPYNFCNNSIFFIDPTGDTIINLAEPGTVNYDRINSAILNFKEKSPKAYDELQAASQNIFIEFSNDNLKSESGRDINGYTIANYELQNNISIQLYPSKNNSENSINEVFFNGVFELKIDHDPSQLVSVSQVPESLIQIKHINIYFDQNSTKSSLNSTLGHEFGHAIFSIRSPVLSYLWNSIQNNDHHNGRGHDINNPSGHYANFFGIKAQ